MFRATNSPILRSTFWLYTAFGTLHRHCRRPVPRVIKFLPHTCNVCGRNLITGLTSAASPRVDISSTCKVGQKIGVSLPLLTCSPSAWASRLLYLRGRKSRRDLWITLYIHYPITFQSTHIQKFILAYPSIHLSPYGSCCTSIHPPRPSAHIFPSKVYSEQTQSSSSQTIFNSVISPYADPGGCAA